MLSLLCYVYCVVALVKTLVLISVLNKIVYLFITTVSVVQFTDVHVLNW